MYCDFWLGTHVGTPTDLLRFNRGQLKYAAYYRIQKAYANSPLLFGAAAQMVVE